MMRGRSILRRVPRALWARLRRLPTRALIARDYLSFRLRYSRVLAAPAASKDAPTALIVSGTEWIYQVKLEGMLAKGLQLKGYESVALVPSGSTFVRRYFRLFGVKRFVELDSFITDEARREAGDEATRLLASGLSTDDLKALTFRGADVGRQVLATASRHIHEGRLDLDDPRIRSVVERLLPQSLASTIAAEALLDEIAPELVLFVERNYTDQGPLSDLALLRGLNVVQFVSAFQDDALVFKRYTLATKGLHPRSLSDGSWERIAVGRWNEPKQQELDDEFGRRYGGAYFLARRNQGWTHPRSPGQILGELALDQSKRTAVIFSHVLWDANMFYGRDLFADQEEWLVETVRAACENDAVNWIVKLHPANVWKRRRDGVEHLELDEVAAIRDAVGELPPHVGLLRPESDIGTRSIFDLAAWGITIRGSIGVELPCFGVPVLTAGTGFYSGRGFTVDSDTPEEYLDRLRSIQRVQPLSNEQTELARKHAYALFFLRGTHFTSFRPVFRSEAGRHPLDQNLVLTVRSRQELERAQDLHRFAEWAVDRRELDYLELPPEPVVAADR
jgi:hypothetical protein